MEVLYLLIAFVIGGVIMILRKSEDEALRIELTKLQGEKHPLETTS